MATSFDSTPFVSQRIPLTHEEKRLLQSNARVLHWKKWGPYLSERAWGTIREDYSAQGDAWHFFPHEHARYKAYRWNEDGLGGICDRRQLICFAVSLWNRKDPILKERLFGLAGPEGNHGEDVKELYYYLDNTPTHSYMSYLYKYPQEEFPYADLVKTNSQRSRSAPEYHIQDTGIWDQGRYFDVYIEYAKVNVEDILIRIRILNRGPEEAWIDVLPTLWFRNTWTWKLNIARPELRKIDEQTIHVEHPERGNYWFYFKKASLLLFTENETNCARLYGTPNPQPYVKDAFHSYLIEKNEASVNPLNRGTKTAAHYPLLIPPGEEAVIQLRLSQAPHHSPFAGFDNLFKQRKLEADEFYQRIIPSSLSEDATRVVRQAFSGLLWSKQFYHYVVTDWLMGDPTQHLPPKERLTGRNHSWSHLYNADVILMPDKWEYPWYAAWDLAFQCVALAPIDPDLAKEQLILLLREWYMHPNGQIPAYEWSLNEVNPPVHAWAAWRVYKIEKKRKGHGDTLFLERVFHKLMLNFTWWVNQKDSEGNNVFEGGFLGLDNISVFDRNQPAPSGGRIEQSDGTSWMAMFCLNMLAMALELADQDPAYEDVASKFWEHFIMISHALNTLGLWHDKDGFYYDMLNLPDGTRQPLQVRSMVGLIPLFAVESSNPELLEKLPSFKRRLEWFVENRPDLTRGCSDMITPGQEQRRLVAILNQEKLQRVLSRMLSTKEFLSPYGIRSLSKAYLHFPYSITIHGTIHPIGYEPAESTSAFLGGNSNWRGPVWFPVNYLIIESLQKFHHYYGDTFKVPFPTENGPLMTLREIAQQLSKRLSHIFLRNANGHRPCYGESELLQTDPHFRDHILFYEYFHGDNGKGLGASHQTGWTALVAKLLIQNGE
ncbi:MGH1-like glycoside hydrolase domain-containing protein [Pajaroellobacter abortibovis]|uniref:Glucosidase n=1 Tax=Pajaroellobacter abortibovis TaxID=1882918 RepID=A0A1L6MXZ5_9BACT|nr:glucosidase [Pajaroellobacter abortibovis]APS00369.1 glucosidase [Pajaroellobacter abortibovis]